MQNPKQKFRQSSVFFRETRCFVWKYENFDELQLPYSSIFFAETSRTIPTCQCLQKGVWDFFKFFLDLELFAKIKKTWFPHTHFLHFY